MIKSFARKSAGEWPGVPPGHSSSRCPSAGKIKSGTGAPLHTKEPVTVASFRTWRGWRENVARNRCLTLHTIKTPPKTGTDSHAFRLLSSHAMTEPGCSAYKKLKDRETRAHTAWTSFLYRNEVKPRLSEKAKRKHQKEEMQAYEQAHKARLAHAKTCPTCMSSLGSDQAPAMEIPQLP